MAFPTIGLITFNKSGCYEQHLRTCPSCSLKTLFLGQEKHVLECRRACSCCKFALFSKREGNWQKVGPSPFPSPKGKGRDYRDTPMANHQHLTPIIQHPSLAVTLCELCMPEAFCGLETVRQKAQWTLCALWEIKLPSDSQASFLTWRVRSFSHRRTQKNRTHKSPQRH